MLWKAFVPFGSLLQFLHKSWTFGDAAHNLLIFHTGKFFVKYRKNSFQCEKNMV